MGFGGYQIIDLENKNHSNDVGMVHKGIYDKIEGTRKPIMLANVVINNTEYHNMFVTFNIIGDAYVGTFRLNEGNVDMPDEYRVDYTILVEDTDVVTFIWEEI